MSELFFWSRAGVKPQMLRGVTYRPGEMINWGLPARPQLPPPQMPLSMGQKIRLALWPFMMDSGYGAIREDTDAT